MIAYAIGLLVISLGAIAAGRGYTNTARRMQTFQATRGTVIAKEAAALASGTQEGRWGRGGGYHPRVTYRYTVGGFEYTNDKVSYALRGMKRKLVEEELAAMPDEVDVHYDPADPQEAYLVKHTPAIGRWFIGGGIFGALFGLVLLLGSL